MVLCALYMVGLRNTDTVGRKY